MPEANGMGPRVGERVVGAFDHRQQGQLLRHVVLFQLLDDVEDVRAAALAGLFDKRGIADKPQALLLDARVDLDIVL